MITVWGGGMSRSFRVVWLLEEMGLAYRIRPVNLLVEELEPAFLAVNPGGWIPVLEDGDVTMVESVAMMEYLMARYGPTPLQPRADDAAYPTYQQFLHMGEAGIGMAVYVMIGARLFAPESDRNSWSARQAAEQYETRLRLVRRQLERAPYMAGDAFTAADISVVYALQLGERNCGITLGEPEKTYVARATDRPAYRRAAETSEAALKAMAEG